MKISAIPTVNGVQVQKPESGDPQVDRISSVRQIKMNTNRTPSPREYEIQAAIQDANKPVTEDKNTISTSNDTAIEGSADEKLPLSPQYAQLARQKRALQVKEKELLERESKLTSGPNSSEILTRLKSNPLAVLQEAGVSYDDLTQAILGNQSDPKLAALEAEIKALKEGTDKRFSDNTTQQEQAALSEMRREATLLAKEGPAYELVRETNSIPDVMQLIERTYKETGEILDVSEAMEEVENYLVEEALKLSKASKVQSKLAPQQTQQLPPKQMKTLTSRDTAGQIMDRKARALAAFHGTLKK